MRTSECRDCQNKQERLGLLASLGGREAAAIVRFINKACPSQPKWPSSKWNCEWREEGASALRPRSEADQRVGESQP